MLLQDSSNLLLIIFLSFHLQSKLSITLYCQLNKCRALKSSILTQTYLSSLMVHTRPLTFFIQSSQIQPRVIPHKKMLCIFLPPCLCSCCFQNRESLLCTSFPIKTFLVLRPRSNATFFIKLTDSSRQNSSLPLISFFET